MPLANPKTHFDILYRDATSIVDQWHNERKGNQWLWQALMRVYYMKPNQTTVEAVAKAIANRGFPLIAEEWRKTINP